MSAQKVLEDFLLEFGSDPGTHAAFLAWMRTHQKEAHALLLKCRVAHTWDVHPADENSGTFALLRTLEPTRMAADVYGLYSRGSSLIWHWRVLDETGETVAEDREETFEEALLAAHTAASNCGWMVTAPQPVFDEAIPAYAVITERPTQPTRLNPSDQIDGTGTGMRFIPIDLTRGNQSRHPDIEAGPQYLARYDGRMAVGTFSLQHYGWSFSGFYPAGLQFDTPGTNYSRWEALWRIVEEGAPTPVDRDEPEADVNALEDGDSDVDWPDFDGWRQ